ncbi:MAG: helix-turn-helix transcriptional regulator [Clostridia bacterium]|nr:helix-turn-helix transcriptional regulator [Clostridia bacterium]
MTIGEKIKELRKKNDLTQEKLADYLCVSYQAVSKWECGLSSPDLSLIGPLTKLLHVSADELLGLKNDGIDARREELENAERETWKNGDLVKRYEIACTAVAEYPGEMKYLNWLAWCEAMRSFDFKDDKECFAEQEKAIRHFAVVIENENDMKNKTSAILGIVQYLCFRGRYDEAKKYAEMYPNNNAVSKERILLWCLQGEERIKHYQWMLAKMLSEILDHIGIGNFEACEAQEKILNAIITDGNYLYFNDHLARNYRKRAAIYTSNGEYERAICCLKKALEYAIAADDADKENTVYRFTSPYLDQLEYNPDDFCRTGCTKCVEDFYEAIKRTPFDKLHSMTDFKQIFNI